MWNLYIALSDLLNPILRLIFPLKSINRYRARQKCFSRRLGGPVCLAIKLKEFCEGSGTDAASYLGG